MRYILFGFNKPYIALPKRAVAVVDLGCQFVLRQVVLLRI